MVGGVDPLTSYFAAQLTCAAGDWSAVEIDLDGCESLADVVEVLREADGDTRLIVIEQDDEYAALVRLDDGADEPRAFVTDGRATQMYRLAALVAEDLREVGGGDGDDPDADAAGVHDSGPIGDATVVDDLGTLAADLLAMCAHPGRLPADVLLAVCENAGCGCAFDDLRG